MLRSPGHARGMTLARKQSPHGMHISFEYFTIDAVCTMLPFVLSMKTLGPSRSTRGLPLFYLYNKYYAYKCVIPFLHLKPGSTSRPVGLPPCTMSVFPAVGQVMCQNLSPLLPQAAARGATVHLARVRGKNKCSHEKWLRTKKIDIAQAGPSPHRPTAVQPAG